MSRYGTLAQGEGLYNTATWTLEEYPRLRRLGVEATASAVVESYQQDSPPPPIGLLVPFALVAAEQALCNATGDDDGDDDGDEFNFGPSRGWREDFHADG